MTLLKTPVKKLNAERYYDLVSKTYDESVNESYLMLKCDEITKSIIKRFVSKNSKILDLGCGTGFVLDAVKEKSTSADVHYLGVDISQGMLNIAKNKFSKEIKNKKVKLVRHNLNKTLPFENESFDLVCSTYSSMNYVKNIKVAIKEAYRVCKINGYILLVMFNKYSLKRLLNFNVSGKEYYKSETNEGTPISSLVYFYSPQEILELIPGKYTLKLLKSQMTLLNIDIINKLVSDDKNMVNAILEFEEKFNGALILNQLGRRFFLVIKKIKS